MLRHYDALGLVTPTGRTGGGYREYSDEDIGRIVQVESLRSLGLSLRQVGYALDDPDFTPSAVVDDLIRWTQDRLVSEQELLERLQAIDCSTPESWPDVMRVVDLLHGLASTGASQRQQAILAQSSHVPVSAELLAGAILAESDPIVAGALSWALARSGGDGVATLAAGMRASDVDTRRRAVRALTTTSAGATAVLIDVFGDPDATVRGHAALALGRSGASVAIPTLVRMVVEGSYDVDAAEVMASLSHAPGCTDRIMDALVDELAAPTADTAIRIRLVQAVVELPGTAAQEVLDRLARDDDSNVALVAAAFVGSGGRVRPAPAPSARPA